MPSGFTSQIALARNGNAESRVKLLEQFRNYLHVLGTTSISKDARNRIDASDVVQETLIKANRRFDQFRGSAENELAAWLRQILANHLADQYRRIHSTQGRDVSREVSLDQLLNQSSRCLAGLLPAGNSSPSHQASRHEHCTILADVLAELPIDYREVILLRSLRELEWSEVAEQMERSEGAVRMLWVRALKQIKPLVQSRIVE